MVATYDIERIAPLDCRWCDEASLVSPCWSGNS